MEKIVIRPTNKTPLVYFNPQCNLFLLKGISIDYNPDIEELTFNKIRSHILESDEGFVVLFALKYYNTRFAKVINYFQHFLNSQYTKNNKGFIYWFIFDPEPNEIALEVKYFNEFFKPPFEVLEYDDEVIKKTLTKYVSEEEALLILR